MLETRIIDPYGRDTKWLSLVWPNIFPATTKKLDESEPEPELEETEMKELAETDPVETHERVPRQDEPENVKGPAQAKKAGVKN